jgi:predicted nucleic acid-binding Zn ribbon protein
MPKKSNDQTIKEAIDLLLETYHLKEKYLETSVAANWEEISGKAIANRTQEVYIKQKKLYLKLSSPMLKQEILLSKKKLISLVNEKVGGEVIKDIVLL